ncbi:MAG: amidohydrolase family protein [Terriglobia bacterium]
MAIFDTHEHIWHEETRLKKRVDFFHLFSHYADSDLVSAGMSAQAVDDLQNQEIPLEKRWRDFAPYWAFTRTTGYGRCMLIAARDLFGIEDVNEQTYRLLSERVTAANRPGWYHNVLKEKAQIELCMLEDVASMNGGPLQTDPRFFKVVARFDYLINATRREDLRHIEKVTGVSVHSLAGQEEALSTAVKLRLREGLAGIKSALAYDRTLQYDEVSRADAARAFDRLFGSNSSRSADPASQKQLVDYMMHKLIQQAVEHHLPVQIHTGFQTGNSNHIAWTNPSHLSGLLNEYPQVRFDLFHGGYPYTSELATLAKNLPNVHPDLCWLHAIAPGVARRALDEWIETVPANKILGFGGDFCHVEGAYGHAQMARMGTAEVLADKVENGYLKEDEAASLVERILHLNGKELFS